MNTVVCNQQNTIHLQVAINNILKLSKIYTNTQIEQRKFTNLIIKFNRIDQMCNIVPRPTTMLSQMLRPLKTSSY